MPRTSTAHVGRTRNRRIGESGDESLTHLRWLLPATLVVLVVIAFANSLSAGLVFDNRVILLEDTRIRAVTAENLRLIVSRSYWWPYTETALYRPATTLSYLFNYAVIGNGSQPAGYHVVNLLLHAANTVLLFVLGERIGGRRWQAFAAAALWAVHPLLTEAVTNIVGRADLLAAFGILAALWCHLRAGDAQGWTRSAWRAGVFAAATFGMFSKESAVAIVAIVPLYDVLLARGTRPVRTLIAGWLPVAVPALLLWAARSLVLDSRAIPAIPFVDNPIVLAGFWQGRSTAVTVLAKYAGLVLWPMSLSCDYSFPQIPLATGTPLEWLQGAAVAGMVAGLLVAVRVSRPVGFACAGALLMLLPASNLLFASGTIMAERLMYLPAYGLIVAIVAVATVLLDGLGLGRAAPVALAILTAALTVATIARNRVWHDEVSLWTDAVAASPRSFKSHGALAEALYQADVSLANLPTVIAHKEQSLALLAGLPDPLLVTQPYREAATYYLERGDWVRQHGGDADEAQRAFEAAGRWAHVYASALDASRNSPQPPTPRQMAEAQLLLSTATLRLNDAGSAVDAAHRSRVAQPFNPVTYRAEAAALVEAHRGNEAAVALLTGFIVTGDVALRTAVIDLYRAGLDEQGCAVRTGASGTVLDQQCGIVRRHLCDASGEAIATYTVAGRAALAANARDVAVQQFGCDVAALSRAPRT